jgi:hypothetical protein
MLKPEEMIQAQAGFAALDERGPAWRGLLGLIGDVAWEANEFATHPDTPEDKRAGWCGRERGLRDLLKELEDVRSGAWKQRAEYREWFTKHREPEEE